MSKYYKRYNTGLHRFAREVCLVAHKIRGRYHSTCNCSKIVSFRFLSPQPPTNELQLNREATSTYYGEPL